MSTIELIPGRKYLVHAATDDAACTIGTFIKKAGGKLIFGNVTEITTVEHCDCIAIAETGVLDAEEYRLDMTPFETCGPSDAMAVAERIASQGRVSVNRLTVDKLTKAAG